MRTVLTTLLVLVSLTPTVVPAEFQDGASSRAEVQAGFVVNILKFVSWPQPSLESGAPIVACLFGSQPMEAALRRYEGSAIGGRPLRVRRIYDPLEAPRCQALFLGEAHARDVDAALRIVETQPVLTLGEEREFLALGGDVAFIAEGQRLRFLINQSNAERRTLKVSAQLLKLAADTERR